jgi:thiamine pyrophosphate-dependent acetolactate synthase large subunit-like protein
LVESLLNEGVDTVFGIPGVGTLAVYNAFVDHPDLRHIEVRHEQGAIFMADGYARASGIPGVAFSSGGPGALNTLTAMATAFNDSVPLLHITCENPASVRRKGRGYFHDISDQFGIFRPVSDFAQQAVLPEEIPSVIHQAMYALLNRRPRPAFVEIAGEALSAQSEVTIPAAARRLIRRLDHTAVEQAVALLCKARRPIIWAGGGIGTPEASQMLVKIAELTGSPVITTQKGKGAIRADHPLHVGNWANELPTRQLLAESDVLLAIGTRFSYFPTGGWSMRVPDQVIQIDMDPAEIGRNYRADIGVVGDAAQAMQAILEGLGHVGYEGLPARLADVARVLGRIDEAVGRPEEIEVLDQLRSALPESAHVFNDPTTIAFWARSVWRSFLPRTWTVPSGFGTLGFAAPAAMGAKVACPNDVSLAIMGDAGAMFTIQDLMTAVQERIPIVLMVFNDRGYGVERRHQDHLYGRRSGVDVQPPDFVALARSFGAGALLVSDLSAVGTALDSAISMAEDTGGPVLVEVPNQFRHPGYGSFGDWPDGG